MAQVGLVPTTNTPDPDAANAINARAGFSSIAFAASVTPDPTSYHSLKIGPLTAGITINNPAAAAEVAGQKIRIYFTQDGTGSRTVTWGNKFKVGSVAITATASNTSVLTFEFDGTNWILVSNQLAIT